MQQLSLYTIILFWMLGVVAFYSLACYLAFEKRLGSPVASIPPDEETGVLGIAKGGIIVALFLTSILATFVFLAFFVPQFFKYLFFAILCSMALSVLSSVIRLIFGLEWTKRLRWVTAISSACGLGLFIWLWVCYPNWIMNDLLALSMGIVILLQMRNLGRRPCITLSVGVMLYDAVAVFGSGHMQKLAKVVGTNMGNVITIPDSLSLDAGFIFMVGLGDVVFPGFIVLLAYRTHRIRGGAGAISGYLAGLIMTIIVLKYFEFPQPATIYLIPGAFLGYWIATRNRPEVVWKTT